MMTNRLTVKVNYILDSQNNEKFIFDNLKNIKIAKNLLKSSLTAIDVS